MVWLLCSMCQLVTAVRLILKFLSINSHRFPIKFPWENSKQLVKPFCECALSLFCSPALVVMRLFCSWVLELCSDLLFVPNAMQAEAGIGPEAIGKLKGTVCLRCLKTVLVVSL